MPISKENLMEFQKSESVEETSSFVVEKDHRKPLACHLMPRKEKTEKVFVKGVMKGVSASEEECIAYASKEDWRLWKGAMENVLGSIKFLNQNFNTKDKFLLLMERCKCTEEDKSSLADFAFHMTEYVFSKAKYAAVTMMKSDEEGGNDAKSESEEDEMGRKEARSKVCLKKNDETSSSEDEENDGEDEKYDEEDDDSQREKCVVTKKKKGMPLAYDMFVVLNKEHKESSMGYSRDEYKPLDEGSIVKFKDFKRNVLKRMSKDVGDKKEKNARVKRMWEKKENSIDEDALKKGLICDWKMFAAKNGKYAKKQGRSIRELWGLYKETWVLLLGKPMPQPQKKKQEEIVDKKDDDHDDCDGENKKKQKEGSVDKKQKKDSDDDDLGDDGEYEREEKQKEECVDKKRKKDSDDDDDLGEYEKEKKQSQQQQQKKKRMIVEEGDESDDKNKEVKKPKIVEENDSEDHDTSDGENKKESTEEEEEEEESQDDDRVEKEVEDENALSD